jgi:predicted enzyme related to lactoylglutathione lyase
MDVAKGQTSPRTAGNEEGFSLSQSQATAKLPARNIERARRFYAEKLRLASIPGAAPGHYLCRCGGTIFVLYETSGRASGTHVQMEFVVSDLETAVRQMEARGVVFAGDIAEDGHTRTARFNDSEDNLLAVREILACPAPNGSSRLR